MKKVKDKDKFSNFPNVPKERHVVELEQRDYRRYRLARAVPKRKIFQSELLFSCFSKYFQKFVLEFGFFTDLHGQMF